MVLALITLFGRSYELVLRPKSPETSAIDVPGFAVEETPTRPGLRKALPSNVYALPSARKAG